MLGCVETRNHELQEEKTAKDTIAARILARRQRTYVTRDPRGEARQWDRERQRERSRVAGTPEEKQGPNVRGTVNKREE